MNLGRCKDCNKPLRWTRTEANKYLALDVEPVDGGNVVIHHTDPNGTEHVRVLRKGEVWVGLTFVAHKATCPARRKVNT